MDNGPPPTTAGTRQRGRRANQWTAAPHPRSCPLPCCSYRALRFHLSRVAFVQTGHPPLSLTTEDFSYSLPLMWPPLRVNLPRRNSWSTFPPILPAMPIPKFPNTSPPPHLHLQYQTFS